ncbi:conserved hypothetical protein [Burkholderia cepacia]|nr:hypothetical protein L810_2269 [Burkholderia sp. AU4i]MDW9231910.1 hypothetical protein [Burkholderia cepacia]QOH39721.1 hypothetical protein C7S14_0097 [Burkholderia cepacia]CAG9265535.1 conserved hypothetical protein [Burkholderia cepacia]
MSPPAWFGIFRNFTAEMDIDEDGLVIDYETLFRRLPAPTGR